ncbi:MAG: TraB/GumN family protein, partial [Verrucomicrobia bacterium]|nr:TraB/GumN family protein [Verrucomicrobiota bacterium]
KRKMMFRERPVPPTLQLTKITPFGDFPYLKRRLLTDRNDAWAGIFERLLGSDRNHLVVVGAAHLVGPDGVVGLLHQRGFNPVQR